MLFPFLPLTPALLHQVIADGYRYHVTHWKGAKDFLITHHNDEVGARQDNTFEKHCVLLDAYNPTHLDHLCNPKWGYQLYSQLIDSRYSIPLLKYYDPIIRQYMIGRNFHKLEADEPLPKTLIYFNRELYIEAGENDWRFRVAFAEISDQQRWRCAHDPYKSGLG